MWRAASSRLWRGPRLAPALAAPNAWSPGTWRGLCNAAEVCETSVAKARQKIFGWAKLGPGDVGESFKTLKQMKRRNGLLGPKVCRARDARSPAQSPVSQSPCGPTAQVVAYFPEMPFIHNHPVLRRERNEARLNRLSLLKKLGRAKPKKSK